MSYFGYPDLDRPLEFEGGGRIYYPFGGGPFQLTPHRCVVADLDDGRINFALDLVRSIALSGPTAYANLEVRLNAEYAGERALSYLRTLDPRAVLSPCPLTDWEFRLEPGPATLDMPSELLDPVQLASNNLGSARLVMRLSAESGLILERLLQDDGAVVNAVAEAGMPGVSPRVSAVVRFRASVLLSALAGITTADGSTTWGSLVRFLSAEADALPIDVSGQVDSDRTTAFGEALADRIIARFGSYLSADRDMAEPRVALYPADDQGETDLTWSLSEPFVASRRLVLRFDLLSDVRRWIQRSGIDAFVRWHTAPAPPSLGQSPIVVFCTLPTERLGLGGLGATLTFPPRPPHRPHAKSVTVLLEPPDDLVQTEVRLGPGEPPRYDYSTFVVISDEQGVRQVDGPVASNVGSPLRLSPDDFPIDFVIIECSNALAALSTITGVCEYDHDGRRFATPFTLDSGRLSASVALPKGSDAVGVSCTATARDGATVSAGPFASRHVRLDLPSFAGYGPQEVVIRCELDGTSSVYAIDLLPAGLADTFENITILAFTAAQPERRFGWFARSPFAPGFRYRPHRHDGGHEPWREVPAPLGHLVLRAEPLRPADETAVVAHSEIAPDGAPISPQAEPTDLLLYTHPTDPARKLYIPRFWVDVQTVSGQQRYRIAIAAQGASSALTVHLVKGPAESLADAARGAEEFPREVAISLSFLQSPPAGARKTLVFNEVTQNGPAVKATLTFATLQERDEVYQALTEPARDARLVVRRTVRVTVPVPPPQKIDWQVIDPHRMDILLPQRPTTGRFQPDLLVLTTPVPTRPWPVPVEPEPLLVLIEREPLLALPRTDLDTVLMLPRKDLDDLDEPRFPKVVIRPKPIDILNPSLPTPVLAFTGREKREVLGSEFVQGNLSITNWAQFSPDFFVPAPDLAPCGANANASRTWVDIYDADTNARLYGFCALSSPEALDKLWFSVAASQDLPARVYVQLADRRAKVVRRSNTVETRAPTPSAPAYQEVVRELDYPVPPTPFAFSPSLHAYMFQGIVPGGETGGLVRFRVQWKDRYHTYLQDAARPNLVYFFPDEFKIARRPEAPFTPYITVRVATRAGMDDTDVVFDYIVAPSTEPGRLRRAREQLIADPRFGATEVEFQPFATSDVRFFIDRPTERGSVREERSGAALVLQGALKDTLVMKLPDFAILFDAMHRDTASLFLGNVQISVPGEHPEVIPFAARMDDLVGELFRYAVTGSSSGGGFRVALTNAIESPVRINALVATVSRGGEAVDASIQGLALPVERLAAGSTVEMTVVPSTPPAGTGPLEVGFAVDGAQVLPDAEAIWEAILDRATLEFFDTIVVKAVPSTFDPIPDRPGDQILAVLVDFEGGATAELNKDKLEAAVRIDYPIDDVILRRGVDTTYRYTMTVVRTDGTQQRDAEPRQQTARVFFLSVQK